ncbi:hypothetical protein EHS13_02755 [Paenibacillus psychroresistens]|uniref:Uncharacterized protein n=1 Tax=Paenibacillus psychroresistens TaxID=1778678 RepID=A0A6B8REG5_9BACL|nr:hypothetical protein [Paenibacillus psychroresistens]QGQ93903.1 hypothetical protein EHS13_02755 [Paenibacillus psychroresistens]
MSDLHLLLEAAGVQLEGRITRYVEAEPIESCKVFWEGTTGKAEMAFGAEWTVDVDYEGLVDSKDGLELIAKFHSCNNSNQSAVALSFIWKDWSEQNYVLVPGAIYAGNRFGVRDLPYAPCWSKLDDHGPDVPTLITDVPRLSIESGIPSAFHLLTGDAASPVIGFIDGKSAHGWLFVTEQATTLGDTSIHMEENADRSSAQISFQAPGVRPQLKYEMATTKIPSTDRGHDFEPGETVQLRCRVYRFPCTSVQELFDKYAEVRRQNEPPANLASSLPFSAAWQIQEQKYNAMNWNEQQGYYAVGTVDMRHQDWQVGWVGGGMSSLALLLEGSELSADRAISTLNFLFSSQTESGFFHGVCYRGQWYGDEFNDDPDRLHPEQWHILRKSADALYFIMKHLIALERVRPTFIIPEIWLNGTRRLADAFVSLWHKYGQFGQWVSTETGDILIGGSAAAGITPAGLALCGQYFDNAAYNEVAQQSADYYYKQYTVLGVTTGGPGEILQCPDSESAFALLESYIVLYETSDDKIWIKRAEEAALQCMTWCVSYDFKFPEGSTFEQLAIRTTGSVIANVQNKHSAPGICTLSGDSLFKLYRATGNEQYIELLREIAGNLPQYLSREDRPVRGWDGNDMPAGYMSERVNMSDWEGKAYVGEVIPLSCWCEVSLMLTYAELPGIYVNLANKQVTAIDQVICGLEVTENGSYVLSVCNRTTFPAKIKLLIENKEQAEKPLGQCASIGWQRIELDPGATIQVPL